MIWCHAALVSDRYYPLHGELYRCALKHAELDEKTESVRQGVVAVSHCQTWILISIYELRMTFIPRAWVSIGKTSRLALTTGLNQMHGPTQGVEMCISPPTDWVEREERRRVFWMAFCIDQYAMVGTGRPSTINETDVCIPLYD